LKSPSYYQVGQMWINRSDTVAEMGQGIMPHKQADRIWAKKSWRARRWIRQRQAHTSHYLSSGQDKA